MKANFFFIIILFIVYTNINAQKWVALGTGITFNIQEKESKEPRDPHFVDNEGYVNNNNKQGYINALVVYKGELYAGGSFEMAGGKKTNNIARWNGKEWLSLCEGIEGYVKALCVYNQELYVGGYFDKAGNTNTKHIAKWDGKNWSPVGLGINSEVESFSQYKDELYVGGGFTSAGEGRPII